VLTEAADWYARQGKVVLAASQVAADLRRRADAELRRMAAEPQPPAADRCTCRQAVHATHHTTTVPGCPWCATKAAEARQDGDRPRCPHCQMPHDLAPDSIPARTCAAVRQRIAEAVRLHTEGEHRLCTRSDCDALQDREPQDGAQSS
jgi:NADH pyrophosphatase NudC (nudix superfamily)